MHIGIVISGLGAGGAERVVALVSNHWVAMGHRVTIFSLDRPEDRCFHDMDERVVKVRLGLASAGGRKRASATIYRRIRGFRAAFSTHRPDVLISFLFKINVLALIASRGLGIPMAVCERNHPLLQPAHPIWRVLVRWTYGWADKVVLQTEASREAMHPSIRSRCMVIFNPVTRFERTPEPEGPKLLAAVGRLEPQKGFRLLIDAFANIADRHPDWTLMIWGEGPLHADLAARIKERGLEGRAVLAGLSNGPADWIGRSSAFVITSEYEGFGNALAEAGAAGLPRVATWFEFGAREQITDEVDGLLLPRRDADLLGTALDQLLSDKDLRKRLGEAAAESGKRYSLPRIIADWDRLLPLLSRSETIPLTPSG